MNCAPPHFPCWRRCARQRTRSRHRSSRCLMSRTGALWSQSCPSGTRQAPETSRTLRSRTLSSRASVTASAIEGTTARRRRSRQEFLGKLQYRRRRSPRRRMAPGLRVPLRRSVAGGPHALRLATRRRRARRGLHADTKCLVPLRSCRATVKRLASTSRRVSRGHDRTAYRMDTVDGGDPRQRVHVRHS